MRQTHPITSMHLVLAAILGLLVAACGDEGGTDSARITANIVSVTPSAGFVPATIELVADFEAGDDVSPSDVTVSWDFGDGAGSSGAFTVTHTYQQAGTYTVTVTMRETGRSGESTATVDIEVYPRADLRATPLSISPAAVRSQDAFRATFDVFNDEGEVPVAFEAGLYFAEGGLLNVSNPPSTEQLANLVLSGDVHLVATQAFESFGEGDQITVDLQDITIPCEIPTDQYQAFAYVDHTGIVGEFDETNNVTFSTDVQPPVVDFINTCSEGPDLSVDNIRGRPSRVNPPLSSLRIDFEVVNTGTESATMFGYDVYLSYLNPDLDAGDTLLASGEVAAVVANNEVDVDLGEVTLDEPQTVLGDYYVIVQIDPDNTVTESNEDNNTSASTPVVVTDDLIPPVDIVPVEFTFDPPTSFLDGSVTLNATVANQGTEDMDAEFFCRVFMSQDDELDTDDDRLLDAISFRAIAANSEVEEQSISLIPGFFDPGLFYLFIYCDPSFRIDEADEDNNILRATDRIEISTDPEVDLRFESFSVTPTTVANEADVELAARVCNDGTNGTGPSLMRVWLSADATLTASDTLFFESLISSVAANDCVDISEMVPAVCDTFQPSYTLFAQLDTTNLLPETNEENNQTTLSPFTIEGIICQCEIDALENNSSGSNNSPSTPTFVSANTYEDLTMCGLARDWYAIPLSAGETVRAIITFESARGNLDLTLFAANRSTILDTSIGDGDREEVVAFVVPEDGDYLLKVAGRSDPENSSDANAYNMTIEITPPVSGIDLFVTNIQLSNTRPVLAESFDVSFDLVNIGDTAAGENTARLYLSEDVEIDPGDDILLGDTTFSDVPGASGIRRRTVEVTMPGEGPGGDRYIGVVADAANDVPGEIDETNNAGVSDVFELNAGCFDPLEPNNSISAATPVELDSDVTTLTGLSVCSDNRDFYEICGLGGDFLRMTSRFDGETYDVDMRLYDTDGRTLDRAEGTGSEEILEVDYLSADRCFILEVVVIGAGREAPYELIIETGEAPEELRCSSVAEPNDTFSTAKRLGDFLESDLAICPVNDLDYFTVNLAAQSEVAFLFEPVEGATNVPQDLRMTLFGVSQNFLGNTVQADEPLSYVPVSTGRYWIRISSVASGPRNQRYRIAVEGLDGRDLQPVDMEVTPGVVVPGERVQYEATILNNRTLDSGIYTYGIYLSDDPVISAANDTLLEEVDMPNLAGASSVDVASRVRVPFDNPGGLQFLGIEVDTGGDVDEFEESNNIALAPLDVLVPCPRDGAEPNNSRIDSVDIADYTGEELWLCPDDQDWFTLDVGVGTSVTIDATFTADDGGDLDIFVWDADLDEVAVGDSIGDNESVSFTAPAGGFVYVQVAPFGLTNFPYTLSVTP